MTRSVPEGFTALTPYLALRDAAKAIDFYREALGAEELYRLPTPDGRIAHAELQLRDARIMVSDEMPGWDNRSAQTLGGSPVGLFVYCEDVDALAKRFIAAGGEVVRPVEDQFYGDRTGTVRDPEGFTWTLAQHIEDVSPEEMARRMSAMFASP